MRYGYDLTNPTEKQMYLDKKEKQMKRAQDTTKTLKEKYVEFIKQEQQEYKYFYNRDLQEKEAAEAEKQIKEQIEKELPQLLEKTMSDLLKDFT